MGVLDDLTKVFDLGAKVVRKEMGEPENTCAQVSLVCPCGHEQTFSLKEWMPTELTEAIKHHVETCDKAKGGG